MTGETNFLSKKKRNHSSNKQTHHTSTKDSGGQRRARSPFFCSAICEGRSVWPCTSVIPQKVLKTPCLHSSAPRIRFFQGKAHNLPSAAWLTLEEKSPCKLHQALLKWNAQGASSQTHIGCNEGPRTLGGPQKRAGWFKRLPLVGSSTLPLTGRFASSVSIMNTQLEKRFRKSQEEDYTRYEQQEKRALYYGLFQVSASD